MAPERDRIAPLDELTGYEVAEGDPDVRGWEVLGVDGQRLGKVDELLADTAAMKIRYLNVGLDREVTGGGVDRQILVPIGYARLDEEADRIFVDGLDRSSVASVPEHGPGSVTRDYETRLRSHYERDYVAGPVATTDFYEHELYDQDRFYASRRGAERRKSEMSESERRQFGELGRGVENDGISPEDDLDHVHGP